MKKSTLKASSSALRSQGGASEHAEERFAFERLLADLAARFADVPAERVVAEIERALEQLVAFFGYDRCTFGELGPDGRLTVVAAAASHRVEPMARGPFDDRMGWFLGELRAGRMVVLPSVPEDLPEEAVAEAAYCRRHGLRSQLSVPLRAGGRVTGVIAFAGTRPAPRWPEELVTRLAIIGGVFLSALARVHAEEELQQLRSSLWHADRVARTGALAGAIAHELNQPLAAILSNAQAALNYLDADRSANEELRAALDAIVRDDRRAAETIRSLRAFLRRGEAERARIDLATAMRDVLEMLDPELRRHGIRVETDFGYGCWVLANKVHTEQVALNLLLNAVAALLAVPREARVLSIAAGASGGAVRLSVSDTGKGIAAADIASVFEPFWTTEPEGLGLGLAICRSIVEAHGGEIEAAPNAGPGATFRITLPFAHLDASVKEEREAICNVGRPAALASALPVVAVVDDDDAVREAVARLLSTAGWAVRSFASAEAFLEQRGATDIGCLLLDVRMGASSGLRLYERLRSEGIAPPVVFLSGHGDIATSVEAMKLGAVEFLEKPIAKDELFAAIGKAFARHEAERSEMRERDDARARIARLSPRERDVFVQVIRGRLNKQIAAELGISEQTVKQHRGRVMEKLAAGSVAQLVRLSEASGLFREA